MESTKDRILSVALAEFSDNGYYRTTMDHLAAEAGVAKGTLYWHFKGKEGLLFAVIDREYAKMEEMAARTLNPESPSTRALANVFDFRSWLDKDIQRFTRLMMSLWTGVSSELRDKVLGRMRRALGYFTDTFEKLLDRLSEDECISGVSNKALATIIMASARGVFLLWSVDPDGVDLDDVSSALNKIIIHRIEEETQRAKL